MGLLFLTGWDGDNVVWHHVSETRDCLVRERASGILNRAAGRQTESHQQFYLSTSRTLLFSSMVELQRVQLIPKGQTQKPQEWACLRSCCKACSRQGKLARHSFKRKDSCCHLVTLQKNAPSIGGSKWRFRNGCNSYVMHKTVGRVGRFWRSGRLFGNSLVGVYYVCAYHF